MTKKDYKLVAGVITEVTLHFVFHGGGLFKEVRDVLVSEFSSALLRDNLRFDIAEFRKEVYKNEKQ